MDACARCGRTRPDDHLLGWLVEQDGPDRTRVVCPDCVRAHVRALEARLDDDWW